MNTANQYQKNIYKYYAAAFFIGFGFFYAVIQSLYFRHFDLSFADIGLLISISLTTTLLLEIPTGLFADRYGKKRSILIATFCKIVALILILFGHTFLVFALGFIVFGIGSAFSSGANSAFLYESLNKLGQSDKYLFHRGRLESVYLVGDIVGASLAPILFSFNVQSPFFIAIVSLFCAFFIQLSMYEEDISGLEKNTGKSGTKEGIKVFFANKAILWFSFFTVVFYVANRFFSDVLQSPLFIEAKGFSYMQLGMIGFISSLMLVVSIFFSNRAEKRLGVKGSLISIILLTPLSLYLLIQSDNYILSAMILAIYLIITSFREIVVEHYIHNHIDNARRATILSINSMLLSLMSLAILPVLGFITDKTSISFGIGLLSGVVLLVSGVMYLSKKF